MTLDYAVGGDNLGLPSPNDLVRDAKTNSIAVFILVSIWILCLTGAVLGVVGVHPFISQLLAFLEGSDEDQAEESTSSDDVRKARRAEIERLQEQVHELEGKLFLAHTENVF